MSSHRRPRPAPPRPDGSALQAFRGEMRATVNLHTFESALVTFAALLLCFAPWALGTMHVWSQVVCFAFASAAFAVSIVNRHYRGALAPEGDFKLIMWPKLVRFPLFWLGLLLLTYILVQALNPAWTYTAEDSYWWLSPVEHLAWLPSGVDAPYKEMNPWRMLVIYSTAWLLVCALWVGITRRIAVQRLLTVIVANGTVFAVLGILQKVTHAPDIFWGAIKANTAGAFFGTIIYKNHAGAYLNLLLILCTALLYWHFSRAERRMERTSPAPIFGFCAVILGLSVLLTNSRAATILLMVFSLIAFIGFVVRCTVYRSETRSPWVMTLLCVVFSLFVGLGAYFLQTDQAFSRLGKLLQDGRADFSVNTRILARSATWDMAQEKLVTGWGAGTFRHAFPDYQRNYPEIYKVPGHPAGARFRWEYAHNDYVQLLAELGLIGAVILLAMLACGVRHLIRERAYLRPHLMFVVLALVITAAHAWVDFQFHNPAILFLWCAAGALVGRWAELESRRSQG